MSSEETILIELDNIEEDFDVGSDPISRANTPTGVDEADHQLLLFNELKNFAEGQANRIARHIDDGAKVGHLYDDDRTTLHILFAAFSASGEDDETKKRSCVESVRTLLDCGADPTAISYSCDRPVLHEAVMNICPVEGLEILLSTPGVSFGIDSRKGGSVLHVLLDSRESYDMDYVEYLIDKGADLESTVIGRTPLDAMAAMDDEKAGPLIDFVLQKRPQLLRKHADSMLRHAVSSGRLATVKLLLKKGATVSRASGNGDGEPLLFSAVRSPCSSFAKFALLRRLKVDIKATDTRSRNIAHIAAECGHFRIMKRAIELGVSPLDADSEGCIPMHLVPRSDYGGPAEMNDCLKCLNYLIENNASVNAKNKRNESPLFLALQRKAKKFIERLVQAGATLADSKLKWLQYDEVTLLSDPQVILVAPKPLDMMLRLGALFAKCAKHDESHRGEFLTLSNDMERLAVEMMDKAKWKANDIMSNLFTRGIEAEQKLFISSPPVQEKIKLYWYGERGEMKKRQYMYKVPLFLMKALLLPFFLFTLLPCRQCDYRRLPRKWMRTVEPCIAYVSNAVTYLLFVVLLIANVSLKSNSVAPATSPSVLDWIVLVFVVALLFQDIYQAYGHGRAVMNYRANLSNFVDFFVAFTFITYYVLLFVGYYVIDDGFEVIRASFHVLGFASLISIVRFLSYLQAHSVLGPIQLSFVGIFYDVVLFHIILGTFLIGFAVCVTSVYSAPVKSLGASANATVHSEVSGMMSSIKTLFWSLFGEFDLSSFEADPLEEAVGMTILALWLVLAVIVLLNMLIALISTGFQRVQDNADIEWKFARAVIILDIWKSPPIPIPINIFHLVALIASHVCCTSCKVKRSPDVAKCMHNDFANHESIREKLREKIEKAEEEGVRRKDLKKLRKHFDKQISTLKTVGFGSKPNTGPGESGSEDFDNNGSSQYSVQLAPTLGWAEFQKEVVAAKRGSRPRSEDNDEEEMLPCGLKSRSRASATTTQVGEDAAREFLEGLRQLRESFQKSFQEHQSKIQESLRNLQSEFQESIQNLQSEFLERQAKVAGSTSVNSE